MSKNKDKKIFGADFLLLCDYAYTAEGGKLSIVGKFDTLNATTFPTNHPEMFLVACLIGEENSEHSLKLQIIDPSGKNLIPIDIPDIKIKLSPTGTGNFMHRMLNFPVQESGEYKFILHSGDKEIGETKLSVIKVPSPAGERTSN